MNKLRENPSDGDSLDIPATEMPNANGIPESEFIVIARLFFVMAFSGSVAIMVVVASSISKFCIDK